jgi:hypothetical protein
MRVFFMFLNRFLRAAALYSLRNDFGFVDTLASSVTVDLHPADSLPLPEPHQRRLWFGALAAPFCPPAF